MSKIAVGWMLIWLAAGAAGAQEEPNWSDREVPRALFMSIEPRRGPGVAGRARYPADFKIARAGAIEIDASFDDWAGAQWITMKGDPHVRQDDIRTKATIQVPEGMTPTDDPGFLGFRYDQMGPEYEQKYQLIDFYDPQGVVLTAVKPDSPAAKAGLREGDVLFTLGGARAAWAHQMSGAIDTVRQKPGPQSLAVTVQRTGRGRWTGPSDLSAQIAFLVDDTNLYFAAKVTDDVHQQTQTRRDIWKQDSIQIGIDPALARQSTLYSEEGHEFGFALKGDQSIAWCWKARQTQGSGRMRDVKVTIKREGDQTLYEAAVPLSDLSPLSPDLWPHCGMDVVINDSDDGVVRKAYLELTPGGMTHRKQTDRFAEFEFAPSPDKTKVSYAWFWDNSYMFQPRSRARMVIAVSSPTQTSMRLWAKWWNPREPDLPPAETEIEIPVTPTPTEYLLLAWTRSQPGKWRFDWNAFDPQGKLLAAEGLPITIKH